MGYIKNLTKYEIKTVDDSLMLPYLGIYDALVSVQTTTP